MVAGDRSDLNSRQGEQDEIILGTWQIALSRAISQHHEARLRRAAAPVEETNVDIRQTDRSGRIQQRR